MYVYKHVSKYASYIINLKVAFMYNKIRQSVSNLETRLVIKRRMLKLILQQVKCEHIKVNKREGIRGLKV